MRTRIALVALSLVSATFSLTAQQAAPPPARVPLAEPSSLARPSEIAFVSGGDIWTVPFAGGEARLLVSHPATESRPLWSPDGARSRSSPSARGNGDVYVLTLATGELRRLTFDDVTEQLDNWSRDGEWLYFSSSSRDIAGMSDVLRVRAERRHADAGRRRPLRQRVLGGARRRTARTHGHHGARRPVRPVVAATATATSTRARSGWCATAAARRPVRAGDHARRQERVADVVGRRRTLYFMSDRSGAENIWTRPAAGGEARQVTRFTDGRVLWPAISHDGRTIVFERDFGVWTLRRGQRRRRAAVPITLRGAPAGRGRRAPGAHDQHPASSRCRPTARRWRSWCAASCSRASAQGRRRRAQRVTATPAARRSSRGRPTAAASPTSSDRDGALQLCLYDFGTRARDAADRAAPAATSSPRWSPDGAPHRVRARRPRAARARRRDAARSALARACSGRDPSPSAVAWSPDGRWLAYAAAPAASGSPTSFVVPAAGGASRGR